MKKYTCAVLLTAALLSAGIFVSGAAAEDSEASRRTLASLPGVGILAEPIQPNIEKYAQKAGLTAAQLQKDIQNRLQTAGVKIFPGDDWLKVPGRPVLYVNINTHETEKYWYAYDIRVELRQIVSLEVNPRIKTLAVTWSTNITGVANIGNLTIIRNDVMVLVDKYAQAHLSVANRK